MKTKTPKIDLPKPKAAKPKRIKATPDKQPRAKKQKHASEYL